jgi:hypothetical protein
MLTCKLKGGLGNQLFQIFTTIECALTNKIPFFFIDIYQLGNGSNGSTIRYTYWNTFLSYLKPFLKNINQLPGLTIMPEKNYMYNPLPKLTNDNSYVLDGYFQCPKYFEKSKISIFKLIKLELNKLSVKTLCPMDYENIISMHFRLGDYKKFPNFHPILNDEYYKNAILYILEQIQTNKRGQKEKPEELEEPEEPEERKKEKQIKILYFCEDSDLTEVTDTILKLQNNLEFSKIIFERSDPKLEDWQQMLQMSLCKYNIIANSTFSWWGAYFNQNIDKIVCYPELWFGPDGPNSSDLFPQDWHKIIL